MSAVKAQLIQEWWCEPGVGDASLEDDHAENFWDEAMGIIQENLTGKTVLDFGCNQGGFLRKLHDNMPLKRGIGVDIARQSIDVANSRKGNRPLEYHATESLALFQGGADIAVSTAVIYLISDLETHACEMFSTLKPGGIYYATHPDYTQSSGGRKQIEEINRFAAVKASEKTLHDIARAFEAAGFVVQIKRLTPKNFMKLSPNSTWYNSVYDQIKHTYEERYAFRFVKPTA